MRKDRKKEKDEEEKKKAAATEDMHSAHSEDEATGEEEADEEMLLARSDPWNKLIQGLQAEVSSHAKRLSDVESAVHGLCWAVLPPMAGDADAPQINQLMQELQEELEQWPEAISHARRQGRSLVVGCRSPEWKREVRDYLAATLEGTRCLVVQHSTETDRQWRGATKMAFYCLQEGMMRKEKGKEKEKEKEKAKGKGRGGPEEGRGPPLRTVWPQPGRTSWEIWGESEEGCPLLLATGHQSALGVYKVLFRRQAQLVGGYRLQGASSRQVWEGDPERGRRLPLRTVSSVKEALEEVVPDKEKKGKGRGGGGGPDKGKGRGGKKGGGGPAKERERRQEEGSRSQRGGKGSGAHAGTGRPRKNKSLLAAYSALSEDDEAAVDTAASAEEARGVRGRAVNRRTRR